MLAGGQHSSVAHDALCAHAVITSLERQPGTSLLTQPCCSAQQAQRLAGELERVQRGRAVAELHASQQIGQAYE